MGRWSVVSVSAWPWVVFGPTAGGTLALTALSSQRTDSPPTTSLMVGVRARTNENVEEFVNPGVWSAQNLGTEWIDDLGAQSASDFEVRLSVTSQGGAAIVGPTLGVFHTLSVDRQWTKTQVGTGSSFFSGTMTIREILNTSNSVSASVTLNATIEL